MEERSLESNNGNNKCTYRQGTLPSCAPLAVAMTPMQQCSEPAYDAHEALVRGTLFPGLDLPFMNVVTTDMPATPLDEVMALDFVVRELQLYLDTHAGDKEAFETLKKMLALSKEATSRYVKKYGPLTVPDLAESSRYDWLDCPWPWVYQD